MARAKKAAAKAIEVNTIVINGKLYAEAPDGSYRPVIDDSVKTPAGKGGSQSKPSSRKGDAEESKTCGKLTIKDFEPVRGKDGEYVWRSYNSKRTKYCYYKATKGDVTDGKPYGTKWYGKIDYSADGPYYKAKAEFEKKYHYVKLCDR